MKIGFLLFMFCAQISFAGQETETVYLPVKAVPSQLMPDRLQYSTDTHIFRQITDGLFGVGEGFSIEPRIAQSVEWSDGGRTVRIQLRQTLFSDGTALKASDVISSLTHCLNNKEKKFLISLGALEGLDDFIEKKSSSIKGLKSENPTSITLKLKMRSPLLLDELSQAECNIIKPSASGSWDLMNGALGTGTYKFEKLSGTDLTLLRNPHFTRGSEAPTRAVFRSTPNFDDFTKLQSWASVSVIPGRNQKPIPEFTEIASADLGTIVVVLNNAKKPFNSKEARRAFLLSIDSIAWAKTMSIDEERAQAGMIPFGMRGFFKHTKESLYTNRQTGLKLLKKLGYSNKNPLVVPMIYSSKSVLDKESAAWKQALVDVPVRIEFELINQGDLIKRQDQGDFVAMRLVKYPGSVEPYRLLTSLHSKSTYNPTKSKDADCDRFIESAVLTEVLLERQKKYDEADACLMKNAVLVPLVSLPESTVMLRKPWKLSRTNQYLLYPYWVSEWKK